MRAIQWLVPLANLDVDVPVRVSRCTIDPAQLAFSHIKIRLDELNRMKLSSALFTGAGLATFVSVLPVISAFGAGLIADAAGCDVNEGTANVCLVAGTDIGPHLYYFFVMGWMFMFSFLYIPVALALVIAGSVAWTRGRYKPERNRKVGRVFWLLLTAAMICPFALKTAVGLGFLAAFFWWRGQKKDFGIEGQQ